MELKYAIYVMYCISMVLKHLERVERGLLGALSHDQYQLFEWRYCVSFNCCIYHYTTVSPLRTQDAKTLMTVKLNQQIGRN